MSGIDHIAGYTYHGRKGAIGNAFRYSVDYLMLDAEDAEATGPTLFSRNGRNLTSLRDADHGGVPGKGTGAQWARAVFEAHQLPVTGRLMLLAQPRVLGHVFNPVSFWFAHDDQDRMIAVIAEVTNTYGDRHSYLCVKPDRSPITPADTLGARKIFHVSPFQPVEGAYKFRFDIGDDRIGVWIEYTSAKGGLIATLCGERAALTNASILQAALRRPLGSRRVLALIHWQALKLWWKGARFRRRPEPPREEVSQ